MNVFLRRSQPPFLVPNVLLLPISLDSIRVLVAILAPVTQIPGPPFLRTIPTYLAVHRIDRNLLPVILGAAATLTDRFAAYRLRRLILRWQEVSLTVAATPFDHTGGCRIPEAPLSGGRFRNCYSVRTASWPMAGSFLDYKTGWK